MLARDALVIYKIDTKKLVFVSSVQVGGDVFVRKDNGWRCE